MQLHHYQSDDGLSLAYRSYLSAQEQHTPVLCLPGLTRNSRDFTELAERYCAGRRILCPDLRGRGFSDHDPHYANYQPPTYMRDVLKLADELELDRFAIIGTSLGGMLAMLIAAQAPQRVVGIVLNDVGPEIDPVGLERISSYTGKLPPVTSWVEAVEQARAVYGDALPGLSDGEWLTHVERAYREDEGGVPRLDMDPKIGDAIREAAPLAIDPWPLFRLLGATPTLLLRGAHSDILSTATAERMQTEKPDMISVTVGNRGHAPLLNEPEAVAAIETFLGNLP